MSEIDEIKTWLNGDRDFDAGIMLHLAYFGNKEQTELLKRNRNKTKLFEVMRERFYVLKQQATTAPDVKASAKQMVVSETNEAGNFVVPKPVLDTWAHLKTEQERWHVELDILLDQEQIQTESNRKQCAELAKLLYDRTTHLDAFGLALNHFKQHGSFPKGVKMEPALPVKKKKAKPIAKLTDADKILRLKNSIAPNISKLKKKIADKKAVYSTLDEKKRGKADETLLEWEQQLAELEKQKREINESQ